jgi:hypothetical protein
MSVRDRLHKDDSQPDRNYDQFPPIEGDPTINLGLVVPLSVAAIGFALWAIITCLW